MLFDEFSEITLQQRKQIALRVIVVGIGDGNEVYRSVGGSEMATGSARRTERLYGMLDSEVG
jgi:hypothetical protein